MIEMNKLLILFCTILFLYGCTENLNDKQENLINKINAIDNQWINYDGLIEEDNTMVQSQFMPYNFKTKYEVSHDTYVSYFNGDKFIKTELYEDTPEIINSVEEADGIILSFNKENKNGIQLTKTDEP